MRGGHVDSTSNTPESALDFSRRDVIENKVDPPLVTLVHHAVLFLIVDLIDIADRHFLRSAIDHEAHSRIGVNGNMYAMTVVKRGMLVVVRLDDSPCLQTCCHRADNRPTGWM